jgi:hypothetical protein
MRIYQKQSELVNATFVEGELIKFKDKVCRVSISRSGPLNALKESIVLTPLSSVVVSEDTQIIFYE